MATPNDQAILNAIINPLLPAEEFNSTNEDDDGTVNLNNVVIVYILTILLFILEKKVGSNMNQMLNKLRPLKRKEFYLQRQVTWNKLC